MKVRSETRKSIRLYPPDPEQKGWRVIRLVSQQQAEQREKEGSWRKLYDSTRQFLGFEIVRDDRELLSLPSSAAISAHEMEINAIGVSRTAGMSEQRRMERTAIKRPAEDRAERVQAKVAVYPHVGSAKGDILRVWPRGESRPPLA